MDHSIEAGMDVTLSCTFDNVDDVDEYTITELKWYVHQAIRAVVRST